MMAFRNGISRNGLPQEWTGMHGKIATLSNVSSLPVSGGNGNISRVPHVGKEGRLSSAMVVPDASGVGPMKSSRSNHLIDDLVWPTTEVTRAIGAVAKGDLDQAMALEVRWPSSGGRIPALGEAGKQDDRPAFRFTSEVTRARARSARKANWAARRRSKVSPVSGRTSTESVNQMAGNLTAQVRSIAM